VTDDPAEAANLAGALAAANEERRALDRTLVEQLCEDIAREAAHTGDAFLVLAGKDFHHGITGIVAGRLKERLRRPVLLLSPHRDGVWKGSGRSLEGCHLYEALASCRDLLLNFGGHAMAAGCAVHETQIPALRERLNAYLNGLGWKAPDDDVWLDACPGLADYTPELLEELERFEPTGQGNPAPALGLLNARVLDTRRDRAGKHLFLRLDDGETIQELPAWGHGDQRDALGPWVHAQVRPRWKKNQLELTIDKLARAEGPRRVSAFARVAIARARLVDERSTGDRLRVLRQCLQATEDVAVYTGDRLPGLDLERAIGARDVQVWSDRQSTYGAVTDLVMWERPYALEAWGRLVAGVSGRVLLLWETPVVEPEISAAWLAAFAREVASLGHLSLPQLLAHPFEATTLMVRAGLEMLREAGLLEIAGTHWTLRQPESPVALASLSSYETYRGAHAFRVLLASGNAEAVRAALLGDRGGLLPV
ncbi:MAG TPA: DHHA1 domain-containing protein, partial [Oscillatoriaceae cyanobacterium]